MDDQTLHLIQRVQSDDRTAVDELFQRYRTPLRIGLRKLLGSRYRALLADSEDAAHDAILSALGRLQQFEYRGKGSFLAWLLKSADFEVRRRLRALDTAKRGGGADLNLDLEGVPDLASEDPTVTRVARGREIADRVRNSLDQLPDREREVIVLSRYMELPMTEVAEELGLPSAGAARALLSRATARLSGLLAGVKDDIP